MSPIARPGRALRIIATLLAVAALTTVLLTALAAGADASRRVALGSGTAKTFPDARFYRSTVSAIEPAVPGLSVTAQANGSVSLTNDSGKTVTVLGYAGEPYLRITPAEVDENTNSLSALLNSTAGQVVPVGAIQNGSPPKWRYQDDSSTAVWRDYRTRWGSPQRSAIVAADAHHPHQVSSWALHLMVNGDPVLVRGAVRWTGTPRFTPRQLTLLVTGLLIGVAGLLLVISRLGHPPLAALRPGRNPRSGGFRRQRQPQEGTP